MQRSERGVSGCAAALDDSEQPRQGAATAGAKLGERLVKARFGGWPGGWRRRGRPSPWPSSPAGRGEERPGLPSSSLRAELTAYPVAARSARARRRKAIVSVVGEP